MKKVSLVILMCISVLSMHAKQEKVIELQPVACCDSNPECYLHRRKQPGKKEFTMYCKSGVLYLNNAPVGGQISFYDVQGNLLVQDVFPASEYAIEIPALAVSIEISYGDVTFRGDLEENN